MDMSVQDYTCGKGLKQAQVQTMLPQEEQDQQPGQIDSVHMTAHAVWQTVSQAHQRCMTLSCLILLYNFNI